MGGLLGGLLGGGGKSQPVVMQAPAATPAPTPAAELAPSPVAKPVGDLLNTSKKPKTKGLLTGDTLGSNTLLGS